MWTPRVAVGPLPDPFAVEAIVDGGGTQVSVEDDPEGLVWLDVADIDGLRAALRSGPDIRWVQLPIAGIESIAGSGILDDGRTWTCAKGSYAEPVAEHALCLALAGLRSLPVRIKATSWGEPAATSLYDEEVVILGAGGIAEKLLEQLAAFRCRVTVVRRRDGPPLQGSTRTVRTENLHDVLPGALVVFLALALTPDTVGIMGTPEFACMDQRAWLINVARGHHVRTHDLVAALQEGAISGAGLDVTDPEPLPDGHRLWSLPNCIITPHTADTDEMIRPLLAHRIRENVRRLGAGEELLGQVDSEAGY